MKYEFGQILRFTYEHQDVDASTGDKFKEVLVLNPHWNNKLHGLDLKRLSPAERRVLEDVLDPALRDKPSPIPLVNDIKRRMDPIMLIRNPVAFYSRFVKPFLRGKDAYRQYIPHLMRGVTKIKDTSISGKHPNIKPLFPGSELGMSSPEDLMGPEPKKALTPIDIMQQNAAKKAGKR